MSRTPWRCTGDWPRRTPPPTNPDPSAALNNLSVRLADTCPRQADRSRESTPKGPSVSRATPETERRHQPCQPAPGPAAVRLTGGSNRSHLSCLQRAGPGSRQDNLRMGFKSSGIRHRLVNCRGPSGARRATEDIAFMRVIVGRVRRRPAPRSPDSRSSVRSKSCGALTRGSAWSRSRRSAPHRLLGR